jgi:glycosyltransferase involved in cell wall biosynthesis
MSPIATVVIPTFDHGPLLTFAIRSVQYQTVRNIEILVIGNGVTDVTRKLVTTMQNQDDRIVFFDNHAGSGNGEDHRHEALLTAQGYIVCYLADDDLWLPNHIELMANRLRRCEFAASYSAYLPPVNPIANARFLLYDLTEPSFVEYFANHYNLLPLSCAGHRLETYLDLEQGWAPPPRRVSSELYMWRKFLTRDGISLGMIYEPTVLHFPAQQRDGSEVEDRFAELRKMWQHISEPSGAYGVQTELRDLLIKLLSHYAAGAGPRFIDRADAAAGLKSGRFKGKIFKRDPIKQLSGR